MESTNYTIEDFKNGKVVLIDDEHEQFEILLDKLGINYFDIVKIGSSYPAILPGEYYFFDSNGRLLCSNFTNWWSLTLPFQSVRNFLVKDEEKIWEPVFGEKMLLKSNCPAPVTEIRYFIGKCTDDCWWVSMKAPLDEQVIKDQSRWKMEIVLCGKEFLTKIEQKTEFTMDEIAEKLGIPVEVLKIKK